MEEPKEPTPSEPKPTPQETPSEPKETPQEQPQQPTQKQNQETNIEIYNKTKTNSAKFIIPIILILLIAFIGVKIMNNPQEQTKILLETNKGNIIIELYTNSPLTTNNFKTLVEKGTYDNTIFHRVIKNFMIQGGDPTGTGMGDPSIPEIQDEYIQGNSNLKYTIAMANRGPNTGSSQFFINLVDNTNLDWDKTPTTSKHPVFGKVVKGMEIVDLIANTQTGAGDKPLEDITIIKATVQ
jgi:peptidylprolyl isomerase